MKLSLCANKVGISYKTAWRWYKAGTLDAYQTPTGMVVVRDPQVERADALPHCLVCAGVLRRSEKRSGASGAAST